MNLLNALILTVLGGVILRAWAAVYAIVPARLIPGEPFDPGKDRWIVFVGVPAIAAGLFAGAAFALGF